MRARKRRARRMPDLPPDDGLIPVPVWDVGRAGTRVMRVVLRTPEEVRWQCAGHMAAHDARSPFLRWGGNQWGEQWVTAAWTRPLFARDQPLLATDLDFKAWRHACR